jgi:Ser/Thr protein kinase RdoA (MazF antagonist)
MRKGNGIMHYDKIAKEVIKSYSIKSKLIEFIGQNFTAVYKVIGENENDKYCLRLHISKDDKKDDKKSVSSELEWISAIAADTNVTVPVPYKNLYDEYVTEIDNISCSLTKWLDGENKLDEETSKLLIEVMAKLHKHASNWTIPAGFKRPSFDVNNVTNVFMPLDNLKSDLVSSDSIRILKEAAQRAISIINSVEKKQATWGLIHNDLQPQNLLFHEGKICPIDFGACGFGFFLSDIATTFHYIPVWYREFFFNEYAKYMKLPDNCKRQTQKRHVV